MTQLVNNVRVTPVETHYRPPNCAQIYCLDTVNLLQVLMSVNRYNTIFYWMKEFNDTPLLTCQTAAPATLYIKAKKKKQQTINYYWEG